MFRFWTANLPLTTKDYFYLLVPYNNSMGFTTFLLTRDCFLFLNNPSEPTGSKGAPGSQDFCWCPSSFCFHSFSLFFLFFILLKIKFVNSVNFWCPCHIGIPQDFVLNPQLFEPKTCTTRIHSFNIRVDLLFSDLDMTGLNYAFIFYI